MALLVFFSAESCCGTGKNRVKRLIVFPFGGNYKVGREVNNTNCVLMKYNNTIMLLLLNYKI